MGFLIAATCFAFLAGNSKDPMLRGVNCAMTVFTFGMAMQDFIMLASLYTQHQP
jgi:hypothetical protein